MAIAGVTRRGPYEIQSLLDAGGMSACGSAEPRTSESEAKHRRQNALGVGPQRPKKMWTPSPCR
jgi:hypothetical protein